MTTDVISIESASSEPIDAEAVPNVALPSNQSNVPVLDGFRTGLKRKARGSVNCADTRAFTNPALDLLSLTEVNGLYNMKLNQHLYSKLAEDEEKCSPKVRASLKKKRKKKTAMQLTSLRLYFNVVTTKPDQYSVGVLATKLQLEKTDVSRWFRNERHKNKIKHRGTRTMGEALPLPRPSDLEKTTKEETIPKKHLPESSTPAAPAPAPVLVPVPEVVPEVVDKVEAAPNPPVVPAGLAPLHRAATRWPPDMMSHQLAFMNMGMARQMRMPPMTQLQARAHAAHLQQAHAAQSAQLYHAVHAAQAVHVVRQAHLERNAQVEYAAEMAMVAASGAYPRPHVFYPHIGAMGAMGGPMYMHR